jgi:hypothetical protein
MPAGRNPLSRLLWLFLFLPALGFADEATLKVEAPEGTTLSKKDDEAVRKVLVDYLDALRTKDYATAGTLLERKSLLATVEPMTHAIASDSTHEDAARRRIFGVSTRDSIEARGNGPLFTSLMGYLLELNPNAANVLEHASIQVLATRQLKGKASVAYQLTLPAEDSNGMPYEQVTAQQMVKENGKWRILFKLEH